MKLAKKLKYAAWGTLNRMLRERVCPSCGCDDGQAIDKKGPFRLFRCDRCRLAYRFPYETPEEMEEFYQREYQQGGLTTDLPDAGQLADLLRANFEGTDKDSKRITASFNALDVDPASKILDFGASWGYVAYQLRQAGYTADAFEVSKPRAEFGLQIGINIRTELSSFERGAYDVVYSSHVLEHVPDPLDSIRQQLSLCRPGGMVIAHTPNGSSARLAVDPATYRGHWGRVHPVLLCEQSVRSVADGRPYFVLAQDYRLPLNDADLSALSRWDKVGPFEGPLEKSELFFVVVA